MSDIVLSPTFDHLSQEYLLVPAWKKSHDYIRQHNWYSDVLELDLTNANLRATINAIAKDIISDKPLVSTPLRLVLAPKTLPWHIKNEKWVPVDGPTAVDRKLRPLAHMCVRDQIISTAYMMLLADHVETRQRDPRMSAIKARALRMVSYGHRLFCDHFEKSLSFRWGNAGVYRQYFQDYQNFVVRPEQIVDEDFGPRDSNWAIISADLSQFYDRVRPELLHSKVLALLGEEHDVKFMKGFETFFNWSWHPNDSKEAMKYANQATPDVIPDFERVALPQGMVTSGFFSNLVLLDFDDAIVSKLSNWSDSGEWQLLDFCRYVDDMRFVVRLGKGFVSEKGIDLETQLISSFSRMITETLDEHAPGLIINPDKCTVVLGRNAAAGSVRVSSSMRRVNRNASGVMDLFVGEETLELIETLLYSSESTAADLGERFHGTILAAKPDVKQDTVARFAANRFRSAFRTLRPMSELTNEKASKLALDSDDDSDNWNSGRFRLGSTLTRETLDQKAGHFVSRLIERWIRDPSNMRLLRVALDLRPDLQTLNVILDLLNEYLGARTKRIASRRVIWYCAAELLKAGATETGLVDDQDKLPDGIDLESYQTRLAVLANEVLKYKNLRPWYLVQQAYLFLACFGEYPDHELPKQPNPDLRSYVLLHKTLIGEYQDLQPGEVPQFTLLHSTLRDPDSAAEAFVKRLTKTGPQQQRRWLTQILSENRALARAIWDCLNAGAKNAWKNLFDGYGVLSGDHFPDLLNLTKSDATYSMLDVAQSPANPFQQEYLAILFALKIIPLLQGDLKIVTPNRVLISAPDWNALCSSQFPVSWQAFRVTLTAVASNDDRFELPNWIEFRDQWKYQLGMLIRVLLIGTPDYTLDRRNRNARSYVVYKAYRSNWLRRRYGLFNGRAAFGDPWVPISSWMGSLLNKLLKWPGFPDVEFDLHLPDSFDAAELIDLLKGRMKVLERLYGRASRTSLLTITVPKVLGFIDHPNSSDDQISLQKMRVGVAQTVIPRDSDFTSFGPRLMDEAFRRKHRRHTASVIAGIQRMLEVRTTHQESVVGIELLVLPELCVHPIDVDAILKPFVKQNRCIVCAGLVFHPVANSDNRLVNLAVWLIPIRKPSGGIEIEIVYQGKYHLTPFERQANITPFRPAQWILELVDPLRPFERLWAMTSSICYDATDLSLASDLRNETDLFIVPALNHDVGTYDNMAAALHYHMFQHVVVVNTGEFGGSSAHAPFSDRNKRTVFHTHGNEQVAVSFFEIDFDLYRNQKEQLKTPPANHRRPS